ncbi:Mtc5p [Aspergillus clavatus NRRL 1]|uniref:WD repeat protein n=1 Tax=Aspergillus clavatus (strain ATCC 1007 / CBS 513.65 / DSM 816 / NCTC 3887 / NRRL 1 / QM 1276 / 107) TaxID=344612 RepID=A1CMS7_ASPCL|nr:WD repeat protein [Aspergillus clavatus NRRL 1]EAW08864.1 WD repeat protein [Aspergillus clavatus NRRL 1]
MSPCAIPRSSRLKFNSSVEESADTEANIGAMEPRPLASAFESPTFGEDSSFHVEQPVGSASISPCGRDVVLASKEGLHIIDLDSPYSPPRYLPHHTPWEVADVQWSPFAARDYWIVSTSNQKALVWNLAMQSWENPIEHVLHAHTRAITDINFSAHHPDTLATCAVDSFVHCWDLRTPSRPVISFSDWFAGATQVKWNRQDPNVIASSHDRFLRIWDKRMGAYPIKSIEAHNTKIYGVDWNRVRPGALVTCSLDKTIKFWDYMVEGEAPEKVITTPFPVWRARNTPFGWGVLAMPQRGNSDLHLYSRRSGEGINLTENLPLVHSFPGHKGQVKEFLWRARGGVADGIDHREFQLVSWGTDRELRLHRVDPDILQRIGYEKGRSFISTLNVTRQGSVYRSFRDIASHDEYSETNSVLSPTPKHGGGTGPNTISVPYAHTWTQGGNADSRVGMQGRSNFRADTNPISWMRGVKISGWDIETLGDEITHVGEKFTKVAFESVDVRQRKATISLHGPWGADGASLFLKVDIKFPVDYPKASMPTFSVQKTAAVTGQLADKIISELRTIAETYLSHKRGCLEGVVRYLLGESSLEESIAYILGETAETVKSPINGELGGDESSDEDEVGMSQSQELGMSSELLRPVNANVMVPVPKACGALWATDGRLVCFFPHKKDKSASLIENLGLREMTRLSRADKVFEGFGRIQTSSPGPKNSGTLTSTDDGGSEYSDDSDAETSSSSGSSDMLSGLQTRFPTPPTWRSAGSLGIYRPRSTDNSQRSTAGGTTAKSESMQNIISIHDFSDLLPAKRELARRYRICGKVTDVCAHNASAALDLGYHELAQIWGLVKLVLHNQNDPLSSPMAGGIDSPSDVRRRDSAVDLSFDVNSEQSRKVMNNSATQWGDHPFGGQWMIPSLLDHFERIGDVQMIAMLSCVLQEPNAGGLSKEATNITEAVSKRTEQQLFSAGFYPPQTTTQNKSQAVTPLASTPKEGHPTPITHSSGRSSSEIWRADATPPYSTGTTPPLASRGGPFTADRKTLSQHISIAASPDQQSQPRSGSGFGSVLASSFSRSFTFGPSSASPPTVALNKKKQSPNGSLNANVATGAWVVNAFAGKPMTAVPGYLNTSTALTSQTHSDSDSERLVQHPKAPKLKVVLKNQGDFDWEKGIRKSTPIPTLDPNKEELYKAYRVAYAHLLSIWGLPVQRSEVLKIGRSESRFKDVVSRARSHSQETSFSLPSLSRRDSQVIDADADDQGLGIQRHCYRCGQALQTSIFMPSVTEASVKNQSKEGSSAIVCQNCKPKRPLPLKLPCVICGEVVEGMLIPCLKCGHVSCFECHRDWFSITASEVQGDQEGAKSDTANGEQDFQTCPSGCGCNCSEHIPSDIPTPLHPSTPPLDGDISPTNTRSKRPDIPARHSDQVSNVGQHEDDLLGQWQESPFASLARGLGGGLSRGLRVKDERRKSRPASTTFIPKKSSMNQVESGD